MCATALADLQAGVDAFKEALEIAERSGDDHLTAIFLGNLASLYEDFGYFDTASDCIAQALRVRLQTPRARAFLYARAAAIALSLGNPKQTFQFLEVAEAASIEAGISPHRAGVLVVHAEALISQDQHEAAWPLVDEAVNLMRPRACSSAELAGLELLRQHRILVTVGRKEMLEADLADRSRTRGAYETLEIEALHEWSAEQHGLQTGGASILDRIKERGLFGLIAKLTSLHICPAGINVLDGESSAQLVARLFPEADRGKPPRAIPFD
jgi:tetratricopeptide (TPR) repeat protein